MLVIISDLHLTDGTSGETIKPGRSEPFGRVFASWPTLLLGEATRRMSLLTELISSYLETFWMSYVLRAGVLLHQRFVRGEIRTTTDLQAW